MNDEVQCDKQCNKKHTNNPQYNERKKNKTRKAETRTSTPAETKNPSFHEQTSLRRRNARENGEKQNKNAENTTKRKQKKYGAIRVSESLCGWKCVLGEGGGKW